MEYNPTVWKDNDVITASKLNKLENAVQEISQMPSESIPAGMISIWSGLESNIPSGWVLCDGTNGTPDLRNMFVLGAGDKYMVGDSGGSEEVTLTVKQMPNHNHSFNTMANSGTGSSSNIANSNYDGTTALSITENRGGNEPHPNMPPYYALCYVMKT